MVNPKLSFPYLSYCSSHWFYHHHRVCSQYSPVDVKSASYSSLAVSGSHHVVGAAFCEALHVHQKAVVPMTGPTAAEHDIICICNCSAHVIPAHVLYVQAHVHLHIHLGCILCQACLCYRCCWTVPCIDRQQAEVSRGLAVCWAGHPLRACCPSSCPSEILRQAA